VKREKNMTEDDELFQFIRKALAADPYPAQRLSMLRSYQPIQLAFKQYGKTQGSMPPSAPQPVPELTAKMFEDAIETIRTHGWGQGTDRNPVTGVVCARGAFYGVDETNSAAMYQSDAAWAFRAHIGEVLELMGLRPTYPSVLAWNDKSERTQEQVIDALELAAKKLRDQGR
jgi:hypothetical protein